MTSRRVDIRLLGGVSVSIDGTPVQLAGRHAPALIALLAMSPGPRGRDVVAADLWPDSGSAACLRQALWLARGAFARAGVDPDTLIDATGDTIGLVAGRATTDVHRFERLARGRAEDAGSAVALYRGDLAEGLGHECFAADRERLADLYEDALATHAERLLALGDMGEARVAAERLLVRDPLREEGHAVLISIYGRSGTRSQVIRQWRRLSRILRRELDVEPLPETEVTYRAALATTVDRSQQAVGRRTLPIPIGRAGGRRPARGLTFAPTG
jgi:DNA-binding SARP family transcriptional activator